MDCYLIKDDNDHYGYNIISKDEALKHFQFDCYQNKDRLSDKKLNIRKSLVKGVREAKHTVANDNASKGSLVFMAGRTRFIYKAPRWWLRIQALTGDRRLQAHHHPGQRNAQGASQAGNTLAALA